MFNYTDAIGPRTKSRALSCHWSCFFVLFSVSHRRVNNGQPLKRRNTIGGAHERVNLAESTPNNFIRATSNQHTQQVAPPEDHLLLCSINRDESKKHALLVFSRGAFISQRCLPPGHFFNADCDQ